MLYKLTLASFIAVAYAASVGGHGEWVPDDASAAKGQRGGGNFAVNCPGERTYCDCSSDCGQSMCECAAAQVDKCCNGRGQPLGDDEGESLVAPPLPDNVGEWKTITTSEDSVTGEETEWTAVAQETPSPEDGGADVETEAEATSEDAGADVETEGMLEEEEEEETESVLEEEEDEAANCEDVCATNTKDWDTKCSWSAKCSGCSSCEQIDNCENWCEGNTQDWTTKCAWTSETCSSCSDCAEGAHAADTEHADPTVDVEHADDVAEK